MSTSVGLWMLLALGVLIVGTGLPVWALLLGTSSLFAVAGLLLGAFDARVLSALTPRLIGLLEHDLLQALPLYVFVGMLLERLRLADAMLALLARLLRPLGGGTALAALGVGALVAPMIGSVASSASLLSRLVAPRLAGLEAAQGVALLSAAATIGIVVPPSLVLLLLGDAMLRAHTEASNLPGFALAGLRIVNTQDVLRAALLPALALLALWAALACWRGRKLPPPQRMPLALREAATGVVAIAAIAGLLAGVFTGLLLAVEAAALAGCALVAWALVRRALAAAQWQGLLAHTLQLSGALMGLLVGATTFSLVFRAWGTDRWLSTLVQHASLPPLATAAALLLFVALCAWVLDAFEMIFVVVPIVAPGLVFHLGDAQQTAVLLLLVLQLGFLAPPMGYALLVVQSRSGLATPPPGRLARALAPYALASWAVLASVLFFPALVHQLDARAASSDAAPALSEDEVVRQMEEMAQPPEPASSDSAEAVPSRQ